MQSGVEHQHPGAGDGLPQKDLVTDIGEQGDDGRLRRSVRVEHPAAGAPGPYRLRRQALTAAGHDLQVVEALGVERREYRGGGEEVSDLLSAQKIVQRRSREHVRRRDDQCRTRRVSEQHLEQRGVEGRIVAVQHTVAGADAVTPASLGGERRQTPVCHGDLLGGAGGAGRRDDVGERVDGRRSIHE